MSDTLEYRDPDFNPRMDRIFLMSDMCDAFTDNIDKTAIGVMRDVGMVALLKGRVESTEIDGKTFDEHTILTLISFRLSGSPFNIVNIRCSGEKALYGHNIRITTSELALSSLKNEDALKDKWRRDRMARTRFNGDWAEHSLAILTRDPLFLGITSISATR